MKSFSCIKHCPLFIDLIDEKMGELSKKFDNRSYKKNETILHGSDKSNALYIIRNGFVKITVIANGKESTIDILKQGDIFGSLLDDQLNSTTSIVAMSDVNVCSMNDEDFELLIKTYPEITFRLLKELSRKLNDAREKIYNITLNNSDLKIYSELKRICSSIGSASDKSCRIFQKVSHQNIADMVGLTRESVTNSLKRLRSEGLIEINKKEIIIHS
jgi:CRP-like cAMP-binding protein